MWLYGACQSLGKKAKEVTNQIIEEKVVIGNYNADLAGLFSLKKENRPYRKIAKNRKMDVIDWNLIYG